MSSGGGERRLLLVHAHPDDETIASGATMARYVAEGAAVTLVTCTLGEEGEILIPSLTQLEAAQADQLGGYRIGELSAAMAELGVTDHRFLGGAGRFRDSGMMATAANTKPRAFWHAHLDDGLFAEAVAALVEIICEVRPQVVITYDDFGAYGHPDHIMAHRITTEAVRLSALGSSGSGPAWSVAKLYWTATPRSVVQQTFTELAGGEPFTAPGPVDEVPYAVPDDLITTAIDATTHQGAKLRALGSHQTQITVAGAYFALSNGLGHSASAIEYFRLIQGEVGPDRDETGRENDLFSGVAPAAPGATR